MKCMIMPVITGATGTATRVLKKNLEDIPSKYSIESLQKQLYMERHTQYGKCRSLELEA
jgi:hypothetical protein